MRDILRTTEHRPWPLPGSPWVLSQTWEHLLFLHWPVSIDVLRRHVPADLSIQTFEGEGWLGIVPFRMAWIRPRGLPALPGLSFFPELNVRTYVECDGIPGVWFLSLEAASRVAVRVARRFFRLPYFDADMRIEHDADAVRYHSERIHRGAPAADFEAAYRPLAAPTLSRAGTLEHWLTERYCLYAAGGAGKLYRAEIHHVPWPLQPAEADIRVNTMAASHGIALPQTQPLVHFARSISVATWPLCAT